MDQHTMDLRDLQAIGKLPRHDGLLERWWARLHRGQ